MSFLGFFFGRKAARAKDPVCGMDVNPEKTEWRSAYEGRAFYFCSKGCKEAFDASPGEFVAAHGPGPAARGHH